MGWATTKAMSVLNKIRYRRTLNKKTTCEKHGKLLVISLIVLGIIIGSTSTFITLEVKSTLSDLYSGNRIVVKAGVSPTPKALASAPSDVRGEEILPTAEELSEKIFALESSRGKNDYCKTIGKVNGYGYRQNAKERVCFNFQEEVRGYVIDWIKEHREEGMSDAELLCHYNQGTVSESCDYYQKSLLIN